MEYVEIAKLIGNYGMGAVCLAVLIALHIYNVRVTMPNLAESSSKQIDKLMTEFTRELAAERQQCHDDHKELSVGISNNQQALVRLLERHNKD